MIVRIIILSFLGLILTSLFSALYYMYHDKGRNKRTVKALTVRIALSISLFVFLMAAFYFGLIPGYRP